MFSIAPTRRMPALLFWAVPILAVTIGGCGEPDRPKAHAGDGSAVPKPAPPPAGGWTWQMVARLPAAPKGWLVLDPFAADSRRFGEGLNTWVNPDDADSEKVRLDGTGPAEVWLRTRTAGGKVVGIAAVRVLFNGDGFDATEAPVRMSAESGILMISDPVLLAGVWKVGGPRNRTNLVLDGKDGTSAERLQTLLAERAFKTTRRADLGYELIDFNDPLDEAALAQVRRLTADSCAPARVNPWIHHAREWVQRRMSDDSFAILSREDRPCAVVVSAGGCEGPYAWKRLLRKGNVIGYQCDFFPDG